MTPFQKLKKKTLVSRPVFFASRSRMSQVSSRSRRISVSNSRLVSKLCMSYFFMKSCKKWLL